MTGPAAAPTLQPINNPLVISSPKDERLKELSNKSPDLRDVLLKYLDTEFQATKSPHGTLLELQVVSWIQVPQALARLHDAQKDIDVKIVFPETLNGQPLPPEVLAEQKQIHELLSKAHKQSPSDLAGIVAEKIATCVEFEKALANNKAYTPTAGKEDENTKKIIKDFVTPWFKEVDFNRSDKTALRVTHLYDAESLMKEVEGSVGGIDKLTTDNLPKYLVSQLKESSENGSVIVQINDLSSPSLPNLERFAEVIMNLGGDTAKVAKIWVGASVAEASKDAPPVELTCEEFLKRSKTNGGPPTPPPAPKGASQGGPAPGGSTPGSSIPGGSTQGGSSTTATPNNSPQNNAAPSGTTTHTGSNGSLPNGSSTQPAAQTSGTSSKGGSNKTLKAVKTFFTPPKIGAPLAGFAKTSAAKVFGKGQPSGTAATPQPSPQAQGTNTPSQSGNQTGGTPTPSATPSPSTNSNSNATPKKGFFSPPDVPGMAVKLVKEVRDRVRNRNNDGAAVAAAAGTTVAAGAAASGGTPQQANATTTIPPTFQLVSGPTPPVASTVQTAATQQTQQAPAAPATSGNPVPQSAAAAQTVATTQPVTQPSSADAIVALSTPPTSLPEQDDVTAADDSNDSNSDADGLATEPADGNTDVDLIADPSMIATTLGGNDGTNSTLSESTTTEEVSVSLAAPPPTISQELVFPERPTEDEGDDLFRSQSFADGSLTSDGEEPASEVKKSSIPGVEPIVESAFPDILLGVYEDDSSASDSGDDAPSKEKLN